LDEKPVYVEKDVYIPPTKFDPKRDAEKDIQHAVAEAQRTGKRILLDVGGDWCIWCRRLDSLFAANKDLAGTLHQEFVVVKVNYSKENKNEAVLSRYPKIPGYPHLFVLDSDGKLLHSQDTGQLESGNHHDHDKVMAFLKKWGPNSLKGGKGS
jgi:thiol:disulfide interchange protein